MLTVYIPVSFRNASGRCQGFDCNQWLAYSGMWWSWRSCQDGRSCKTADSLNISRLFFAQVVRLSNIVQMAREAAVDVKFQLPIWAEMHTEYALYNHFVQKYNVRAMLHHMVDLRFPWRMFCSVENRCLHVIEFVKSTKQLRSVSRHQTPNWLSHRMSRVEMGHNSRFLIRTNAISK